MLRRLLSLLPALAAVASGGALLTQPLSAANRATAHLHGSHPRLRGTNVWASGRRPAPNFGLRDQNGHRVTTHSLRGHIWLATFMDAHCTKQCPIIAREIAATQRALGRSHSPMQLVVIDVDPQKDRPASTRAFIHKMGITGPWHWLLGTKTQLTPAWNAWGTYVLYSNADVNHTVAAYLVDQRGNVRVADMVPINPRWLAESVRALQLASHKR